MSAIVKERPAVATAGVTPTVLRREDQVNTANLSAWRRAVLSAALAGLTNPRLPDLQRQGGVWKWNEQIPYPSLDDVLILDTGCLKFEVDCGGTVVIFSVWMQIGEVRVGAKVPNALLLSDAIRGRVSRAYDGQQCQRTELIGDCTMFDWIWEDREFAEFAFMVRSLRDPMLASVIADRIVSVVTHLYLSVVNTLIEGHAFKVGFRRITRVPLKGVLVHIRGDGEAIEWFVKEQRRYTIDKSVRRADGTSVYFVLMPENGVNLPGSGRIREPDGAECLILGTKEAKGHEIDWRDGTVRG